MTIRRRLVRTEDLLKCDDCSFEVLAYFLGDVKRQWEEHINTTKHKMTLSSTNYYEVKNER